MGVIFKKRGGELEIFGLSIIVLLKLIMIDIVLSGDNAVVIAMASRNVPIDKRNKAIFIGTLGAIILRLIFAAIIVYLLRIPFVTLAGGVLLTYIAYNLLVSSDGEHKNGGATVWSAVKTIIIADAVMSLDNVLALAGAAHGSLMAILVGVVVSIPIIIFCSKLILKAMEKYPIITYVGAGILAWTAGDMIVSEPHLKNISLLHVAHLIPAILTIFVVGLGYIVSKKKKSINQQS